jgi:drug/metabolite transporter (DMT)-like permease
VPTESVTVFCLATACFRRWRTWPGTDDLAWGRLAGWPVLALGRTGGAAFFTWDVGMKKGDIQLLGVASYAAPLLSTLALVAAGLVSASPPRLALAAVLIAGGRSAGARASAAARPHAC